MKTLAIGTLVIIAVAAAMAFLGCFGGQTPAPTNTPSTTPSAASTPQINEERELVKQWWQMYTEPQDSKIDEDSLNWLMEMLKKWDVHPIEIYRGSMLFYEKSYGYIYIPDLEEGVREMPPGMTETKFVDLVEEHGGTTTVFFSWGQPCACFPNLRDAEKFLADFWKL